jgi:hypothetical protein
MFYFCDIWKCVIASIFLEVEPETSLRHGYDSCVPYNIFVA